MKRATVRTALPDAERVAAAVRPDNTPELLTRVEGDAVVTTVERPTSAGLRSTLDDYLVNVALASAVGATADRHDANEHDDTTP